MKTKSLLVIGAVVAFALAPLHAQQSYGGCQLFPADSVFHLRVDSLPVSTNPAAQIPTADLTMLLHPIFGATAGNGYEVNVVPATQASVTVTGNTMYWKSAPIPSNALLEGNGSGCTGTTTSQDCHLIVLQQAASSGGACTLWEAYGAAPGSSSGYNVNGENPSANLGGYTMIPEDNGGANAAGIYILPFLVTSADLAAGSIQHAIAISVPNPPEMYQQYLWPAAAFGGTGKCTGGYADANSMLLDAYPPTSCPSNGPAAGTVYRRKASATPLACVTAGSCPQTAMIETAAERYGLIVVDNGSSFFGILGEQSANWSDTDLHNLTSDVASNYEPVAVGLQAADLTAPIGNANILAPVTTYRVKAVSTSGTPIVITATYNGVTQTATVTVTPSTTAALASVSVSPASVTSGQTATVTIALTAVAPTGGAVVTLATSDSTHFPLPTSYTVPAGQATASFTVTTN